MGSDTIALIEIETKNEAVNVHFFVNLLFCFEYITEIFSKGILLIIPGLVNTCSALELED